MRNAPASGNGIALPTCTLHELHDNIALALDAVSVPSPCQRTISEARGYLSDALRQIGGAV